MDFCLLGGIGSGSTLWNLEPPCLMWIIWTEHNRRTFENLENLEDQPFALFVGTLFERSHTWGFTSSDPIGPILMFIDSLSYCT